MTETRLYYSLEEAVAPPCPNLPYVTTVRTVPDCYAMVLTDRYTVKQERYRRVVALERESRESLITVTGTVAFNRYYIIYYDNI